MEIAHRDQLDQDVAELLRSMNDRHRELLRQYLGNPPDVDNVPPAFWIRARKEYEEEVAAALLLIFMTSVTEHGGSDTDTEALLNGRVWSAQRSRDLSSQLTSATYDRLDRASREWSEQRAEGAIIDPGEVDQVLDDLYGEQRTRRIAEDLVTRGQTAGGEYGVSRTVGLSPHDTWFTVGDGAVCPICLPLHDTVRQTWSGEFPQGPPAHPGCRCWIRYDNLSEPQGGTP